MPRSRTAEQPATPGDPELVSRWLIVCLHVRLLAWRVSECYTAFSSERFDMTVVAKLQSTAMVTRLTNGMSKRNLRRIFGSLLRLRL